MEINSRDLHVLANGLRWLTSMLPPQYGSIVQRVHSESMRAILYAGQAFVIYKFLYNKLTVVNVNSYGIANTSTNQICRVNKFIQHKLSLH